MGYKKRVKQADLARVLGVTSQTLTKFKHDPTFPPFDKDSLAEIYAVCVWWYLRKEASPVPTDETLMGGADSSDGLERYRLARAQQEEIKLAETRGQVVMLGDFMEATATAFGPWRRLAEHIKRLDNQEMFELVEEANREVLANLEKLYGHGDTDQPNELD